MLLIKMKIPSIDNRKVRIIGALLFATLATSCFGPGWGGGGTYYGGGGPAYYPGNVYSNNVYRGYGHYDEPGRSVFGGYAPGTRGLDRKRVGVDPAWEGSRQRALDIRAGDTAVAKHTVVLMVEVANVGTNRGWRGISMLQLLHFNFRMTAEEARSDGWRWWRCAPALYLGSAIVRWPRRRSPARRPSIQPLKRRCFRRRGPES